MDTASRVARRHIASLVEYSSSGTPERPWVTARLGGEVVGETELQAVDESFWTGARCGDAVRSAVAALTAERGAEPYVFVVRNTRVEREHRGSGIGIGMYEYTLEAFRRRRRGCVLVAEACIGGKTSPAASRIWTSLNRRWVGEGGVAASVRR